MTIMALAYQSSIHRNYWSIGHRRYQRIHYRGIHRHGFPHFASDRFDRLSWSPWKSCWYLGWPSALRLIYDMRTENFLCFSRTGLLPSLEFVTTIRRSHLQVKLRSTWITGHPSGVTRHEPVDNPHAEDQVQSIPNAIAGSCQGRHNDAQQVQCRSADKKRIATALIKEGDWVLLRRKRELAPLVDGPFQAPPTLMRILPSTFPEYIKATACNSAIRRL
jgi:hypothetical protein